MLKIFLPLLTVVLSSAACEKDDESKDANATDAAPESAFLDASALAKPASTASLTSAELNEVIIDNEDFFQNDDAGVGLTGDETNEGAGKMDTTSSCVEALTSSGRFKVVDSKVIYGAAYDLTSCFAQTEAPAGGAEGSQSKLTEIKGMIYTEFSCEGVDLSAFDGKTLKEVGDLESDCPGAGSMLLNTSSTSKAEVYIGDKTVLYESSDSFAQSTPENGPCQITKEGNLFGYAAACRQVEISNAKFNDKTESSYFMTLSQNLKWEAGKKWYSSGSMEATINDWTGSVVYTAGAAPTYTFTRGAETVSGTFGVSATLRAMTQSKIKASLMKTQANLAQTAAQLRLQK